MKFVVTWKKLRLLLLAVTFVSVLFILAQSFLEPVIQENILSPFTFPATVSLPGWQFVESKELANPIVQDTEYSSGQHYRYVQNGLPLEIEMRYLVNTGADIKGLIRKLTGSTSLMVREQQGVGFYSLFVYQGRAYLSACINPRGGSTVTNGQFRRNRKIYDVRLNRIFAWLFGQAELQDKRCLWAHLSIPLNHSSPETAYETLETAWVSWYQWWSHRFPDS